ncbi:MAG: ABC transporter permease, partial [Planctomycetes bacterium]|nr:ABC transporter permease [Planctomycetota bacterium]
MIQPNDVAASGRHSPFLALVVARVREFGREPAAIFWVYIFPLILVVALGAAFRNRPVGPFTVAVAGGGRSSEIRTALAGDDRLEAAVYGEAEARQRLRTGRADLVIVPHGSGYEYLFDPTQANSVLARETADSVLQRAAGREDAVDVEDHPVVEPGGRYIDFLVPGLVGLGLLGGGLWGVGFAIVDMRIRKLLKRYLATPMKRSHFLAAVMVSRLLFTI